MCGFITQLVEHHSGITKVTGLNPIEALFFFSGFFFPIAQIGKFTAMITLHFHKLSSFACNYLGKVLAEYERFVLFHRSGDKQDAKEK